MSRFIDDDGKQKEGNGVEKRDRGQRGEILKGRRRYSEGQERKKARDYTTRVSK